MRRSNSARLPASSAAAASPRPRALPASAVPAARQASQDVGGNLERRRRSSRAPCARPRSRRRRAASRARSLVPALVGAPKPIVVLQAISVGRSDCLAPSRSRRRWPPDRGRRRARRSSRRPRSASTWSTRIGERQRAVDGDAVVVEQHDQLVQLQMAGERDRLLADAFHQVAVGGEHIGAVIDDVVAELGGEVRFGDRHADGVGEALAERAGGGLDAGR